MDNLDIYSHPAAASGAKREKLNVAPYDLVPFQEMTEAYVRVAEFGARKYAAWNWSAGLSRVQILGSLLRHAFAYMRGEDKDKDSGLNHTDHILWNAVALVHNVQWRLEDGRRTEPYRSYKELGEHAPALHAASKDDEGTRYEVGAHAGVDATWLTGKTPPVNLAQWPTESV